ncbi:MAG: amidohydrolase family protein [Acidimicrobiales bacterium]|nr:amidohydrolase family protein [Acidimicrobiales bacterium]MDG2216761.1 amidohydrolase family protein [Acidimicrobiales bacterium]
MTYAQDRRIIDVDSHLFELDDFLHSVATAKEAGYLTPMEEQTELPVSMEAIERGREHLVRRNADPDVMAKFEASMFDIRRNPWSRLGAFDPADRSHALDVLGFEHQIVLGTFSFHQIAHSPDAKALEVGARVYNRAMGQFCANDKRMLAGGYVPLSLGPDIAGQLLDEAFADGCYTVMIDTNEANPEARSFTHPDFDPVWARFADRDVPIILHIAVNGHYDPVSPSFKNNGRRSTAVGGDAPDTSLGLVAMNNSVEMFLSAMILDEVFERHDRLRCLSLEHGASWVPGWLHKLDFVGHTTRHAARRDRPASEIARERVRFAPFAGEPVGWLIEQLGPDMLCFASDYPHPEGSSDPIAKFEAAMDGIDPIACDAFYAGNIERFVGRSSLEG